MDEKTIEQAKTYCSLPFVSFASLMPDAHYGKGSTVGSVMASAKVIVPAAVGVDIGCGMIAVKTTLRAADLPDSLKKLRSCIEQYVPHGRSHRGTPDKDIGSWKNSPPKNVCTRWATELKTDFEDIVQKNPKVGKSSHLNHLGSLGGGNHFIEVCLDLQDMVWLMLHSGSRGVGNRIGSYFISKAQREMEKLCIHLPDRDLAYLQEGSIYFKDYYKALSWAQKYARINREIMMDYVQKALSDVVKKPYKITGTAINCHHNYVQKEIHYGKELWVTRKGAVRAGEGEMGIIPGSMGAKSFIVRGKGNKDSLLSCSHGAGRIMSRRAAEKRFTEKRP